MTSKAHSASSGRGTTSNIRTVRFLGSDRNTSDERKRVIWHFLSGGADFLQSIFDIILDTLSIDHFRMLVDHSSNKESH
jgi:hypothetical protein